MYNFSTLYCWQIYKPSLCIPIKAQNMVDKHSSRYKFNSSYSQIEKQSWSQNRPFFQGNIHRYFQGSMNSFQSVCSVSTYPWIHDMITFLVLDHQPAENNVAPSGVLSITPNEDTRVKQWHSGSQTMNLLNMNIKVLIYASS